MYFPNENPIEQRIMLSDTPPGAEPPWLTIIGVSPTIRQRNRWDPEPDPVVYIPYRLAPMPSMSLLVRTHGEPSAATAVLRQEVRALDQDLPLFGIATMDQSLAQLRWPFRFFGTMFTIFGLIALGLSALGLYAITSFSVTQRAREIGVRVALGAQPRQVWWLIVRRSLVQLAIGLTLGLAGAFGVGRLLRAMLVQTSVNDPLTLSAIVALFVMVSFAACYRPARRATELDPINALRYE